jgi:hypothetical protein
MSTTTEPKQEILVAPFGIEIDHPRNDDVMLQSIVGLRLRSAINGSKGVIDANGDLRVPQDQSRALASFPHTPGMQLHINPRDLTYVVVDPLNDNPDMCNRVLRFLKEHGGTSVKEVKGVPTQKGELDVDRMKTLCREIIWLLTAGEAKICKGAVPKLEDVEDLPGKFLLNPGSRVQNTQPRYEEDWDAWVSNLSRSGG